MCGICGMVYSDPAHPVDASALTAMRDSLLHRGPDDAGTYAARGAGLASRRLAILDLSERGHMPMSLDGRYWIVYNGEVYNYRELRAGLEQAGGVFRSNTDTEVLLALYVDEGPAMLDRLNGMFAIAIWDALRRELFLARDRLGVKPLYFAASSGAIHFASEQKALFRAGIAPRMDPGVWQELLCFRYAAGARTPYAGIHRILPGHYLMWRDGRYEIRRWWHLAERVAARRERPRPDTGRWFRETFDDAVRLRRISDVPLGVLLSGGLDSGSVAASLAISSERPVAGFTVRFRERGYDEWPPATALARRWGIERHELSVTPSGLLASFRRASWLNDEPLAHGSDVHLWAISKHARSRVTVLLSGEGGDETLGGYVRYRPLFHPALLSAARRVLPKAVHLGLNGRARKLARLAGLDSIDSCVLFNAADVLADELAELGFATTDLCGYRTEVLAEAKAAFPREPARQAMYLDLHTFLCSVLDRNDRMTMGASIECRTPFLDFRLVEGLAALSSGELFRGRGSKPLLRRSLGDRLPSEVLRHRKWGFGVPWSRYLRSEPDWNDLVRSLPDREPIASGPLDRARLRSLLARFCAGDESREVLVRQLVAIAVWHEEVFSSELRAGAHAR